VGERERQERGERGGRDLQTEEESISRDDIEGGSVTVSYAMATSSCSGIGDSVTPKTASSNSVARLNGSQGGWNIIHAAGGKRKEGR
jgi:hypothetical protein